MLCAVVGKVKRYCRSDPFTTPHSEVHVSVCEGGEVLKTKLPLQQKTLFYVFIIFEFRKVNIIFKQKNFKIDVFVII